MSSSSHVTCEQAGWQPITRLLAGYGLELRRVDTGEPIPGSHWGEPEAGLIGSAVYARSDTPVHSLLHEACHAICMGEERRAVLDTDAGGDDDEESAVCYLQVLLADRLPGVGSERLMSDMDAWGYSFRLGTTRAWFEGDAADARRWLKDRGLVDGRGLPVIQSADPSRHTIRMFDRAVPTSTEPKETSHAPLDPDHRLPDLVESRRRRSRNGGRRRIRDAPADLRSGRYQDAPGGRRSVLQPRDQEP